MRFLEFHHSPLLSLFLPNAASLVIIRYLPCVPHPSLQLALTFFSTPSSQGTSTTRLCRPWTCKVRVVSRLPTSFWAQGLCALNPHRGRGRGRGRGCVILESRQPGFRDLW